MKVFITGATGYIGSAVTRAFVHAGHEVTILARPSASALEIDSLSVRRLEGDLGRLKAIQRDIADHDVWIHAAKSSGPDAATLDREAIDILVSTGPRRGEMIYTSGCWSFSNTGDRQVDESTTPDPLEISSWRIPHEQIVLRSSRAEFQTAVIRPGCVYGGKQGLLAPMFEAAEKGEPLEIVGDGENHWAMIDIDDVADCYLKVAEEGASGIFHAIDDTHATMNEIAKAIAETAGKGSEIRHIPLEEARASMGLFADALAVDQKISSRETRRRLDWAPASETFFDTLERQWEAWRESR